MAGILGGLFDGLFGGEDIYGRKPDVPEFPSLEESIRKALESNFGNFEQYKELAGKASDADLEQMLTMIRKVIPGYNKMIKRGTHLTKQLLDGKLPGDVVDEVARHSAERSVSGGYAGSGMAKNLEARDLGLTSLDLTQRGLASVDRWMSYGSTLAGQNQMSASSMFLNPAAFYGAATQDWDARWMQEKIDASPDPVKRGQMDTSMELIGMVLSAYGGGSGYKSTYDPSSNYTMGSGGGGGAGGGGGYAGSRGWHPNQSEYSSSGGGGTDLTKAVGFF